MYVILGLLSAFFASLVAIFGKVGIGKIDSTLATTLRATVMLGFFLVATTVLGRWRGVNAIDDRAMLFIILTGLAGALSWFFYFAALKIGPASHVAALDRLSIIFAVILAFLFLSEKVSPLGWAGAALMAVGAVMLVKA